MFSNLIYLESPQIIWCLDQGRESLIRDESLLIHCYNVTVRSTDPGHRPAIKYKHVTKWIQFLLQFINCELVNFCSLIVEKPHQWIVNEYWFNHILVFEFYCTVCFLTTRMVIYSDILQYLKSSPHRKMARNFDCKKIVCRWHLFHFLTFVVSIISFNFLRNLSFV